MDKASNTSQGTPSQDTPTHSPPHLRRRRKGGIRMNINQLGEAILGESEAHHRLQQLQVLSFNFSYRKRVGEEKECIILIADGGKEVK